jgi:Helicase C-terminal domain
MLACVSAGALNANAWSDHTITREEIDDASRLERDKVFLQIAGAIALMRMGRVHPFGVANHISGPAKPRAQCTIDPHRRAAEVIEMKMSGQNDIDRVRSEAGLGERVIESTAAIEPVDVDLLGTHLVPSTAVDDHATPGRFDEQRPYRELNPVAFVRRGQLLPQWTRYHAEHRSAIQPEWTVVKDSQLEITKCQLPDREPDVRLGTLFQFDQDAMGCRRMNERNQRTLCARPRLAVDETYASGAEMRQCCAQVVDAQCHVMKPRPAFANVRSDCRIRRRRFQQLQRRPAHGHSARSHALGDDLLGSVHLEAQGIPIKGERLVDVLNSDANVIEGGSHRDSRLPGRRSASREGGGARDSGGVHDSEFEDGVDEAIATIARRARDLRQDLRFLLRADDEGFVFYLEHRGLGTFLRASPVDVSRIVRDALFDRFRTVVLTSATLAVDGSFNYIKGRLGIGVAGELQVASEFDYAQQALLYLPRRMPPPKSTSFSEAVARETIALLTRSRGRAFVLFTSYRILRAVQPLVEMALPYPILVQGTAPRSALIDEFRSTPNAVLLATSSFWQGVDVVGDSLSCVVIDKLPFASPGDPVISARIDAINARGGDAFADYQVPLAILSLQQGLGRLLRHRSDRGVLAVLDPRLATMGYGRRFLASLPPAPVTRDLGAVDRFFNVD